MSDVARPCASVLVERDGHVVVLVPLVVEPASALACFDALLHLRVVLARRGARLRLADVDPEVTELLVLVGFHDLLS